MVVDMRAGDKCSMQLGSGNISSQDDELLLEQCLQKCTQVLILVCRVVLIVRKSPQDLCQFNIGCGQHMCRDRL